MTPSEKTMVEALFAVAWADGTLDKPEESMIDGLLWAFEATDAEEKELREKATSKVSIGDVDLTALSDDDRLQLIANAALLTHADGDQTDDEKALLGKVVEATGVPQDTADQAIAEAASRGKKLAEGIKRKG